MKIDELLSKYKDANFRDPSIVVGLNAVANYVMFEQSIIKKDNIPGHSIIKYRYDAYSYKVINDFFSKIEFAPELVIGSGKSVVVKELPDEYKHPSKHEISFEKKLYILDKIKDSFMHLNKDETMYDFDFEKKVVKIKNIGHDYSLICDIPLKALIRFNSLIKVSYDESMPSLDWIDDFILNYDTYDKFRGTLMFENSLGLRTMRIGRNRRVIYYPNKNKFYCYFIEKTAHGSKSLSIHDYNGYHTDSYISLLKASSEGMNFPIIDCLYDFDFHCVHKEYKTKIKKFVELLNSFYESIYNNIEYKSEESVKNAIINFLFFHDKQNGKEKGLICEISSINNMIITQFMRNARSHANNKGIDKKAPLRSENIVFYDVSYNSLQNKISKKTVPLFALKGKRYEFDDFFDDLRTSSVSNADLYDQINNELILGTNDTFESLLQQLSCVINQCCKEVSLYAKEEKELSESERVYFKENKDYINSKIYPENLKAPIGNASDFVDFLRKIMNGTFEYEKGKTLIN